MKKIFLFALLLSAGISLSAQNTVSGTVTDKKGNPIPGAKVEIKEERNQPLQSWMVRLRWRARFLQKGESLLCGHAGKRAEGETGYAYQDVG